MPANKKILSISFRLSAFTALTLTTFLASSPVFAAEPYFRSYAPSAIPPLELPPVILGDLTRIPAARPPVPGPANATFGANNGPQGRLRLRPANFGGM